MTISKRFEMQAPHKTRIFPSMHGCVIEFTDETRQLVIDWFRSEIVRFEQESTAQEDLVVCPRCGGKLELKGGVPVVCTLCHGRGKVTQPMADAYAKSLNQEITVVRRQSFDSEEPKQIVTIIHQQPEEAHTTVTTVIDSDDEFIAPEPGDEGFIGPVQEK